jgi:hypothetical protein
MLDSSSSEDDGDTPSPNPHASILSEGHHNFVFGYSSSRLSLIDLHPPPEDIVKLWQVYLSSVDPLLKVSHAPTTQAQVLHAKDDLENVSRATEALMFSIYFASVTSMDDDQCRDMLGQEKSILTEKYWFATEQALARAGFLNTPELVVLQAFVLFLVCLPFFRPTTFVSSLVVDLRFRVPQYWPSLTVIRSVSAVTMARASCGP